MINILYIIGAIVIIVVLFLIKKRISDKRIIASAKQVFDKMEKYPCQQCGTMNPELLPVCLKCGAKKPTIVHVFCGSCGEEMEMFPSIVEDIKKEFGNICCNSCCPSGEIQTKTKYLGIMSTNISQAIDITRRYGVGYDPYKTERK